MRACAWALPVALGDHRLPLPAYLRLLALVEALGPSLDGTAEIPLPAVATA